MKKIFCLSFLLIPSVTQCMKAVRCIQTEVNLSKATPAERQELISKHFSSAQNIEIPYYQENHHLIMQNQQALKEFNVHGYSAIGVAAASIKVYSLMPNSTQHHFDEASYEEKTRCIEELKKLNIQQTPNDEELLLKIQEARK